MYQSNKNNSFALLKIRFKERKNIKYYHLPLEIYALSNIQVVVMRTFHVAWALHLLYNLYWCKNPFLLIIFTSFIDTWWGISLHFLLWESSKTFAWWTSWDFIQFKKSLISLPHKNIIDSVQRFFQKSFLLNNFFFACFVFYFNQFVINQVVLLS